MPFISRCVGQCARTGHRIRPGDLIDRVGRGKYVLVDPRADARALERPPSDNQVLRALDPELWESDPDGARAAGRYLRRAMTRSVSSTWVMGGREHYRNRRGLCEDAPCCGCCNA
jgi:hypothetical protein